MEIFIRFWSKYLIQRNTAENILKPNILQTLLSGRKRREAGMEEEMSDNMVDSLGSDEERARLLELLGKYDCGIDLGHKK